MIKNLSDLCVLMGASPKTEDALRKKVYKYTRCGAWAGLEDIISERVVTVKVLGTFSNLGYVVKAVRLNGKAVKDVPSQVVEFLEAQREEVGLVVPPEIMTILENTLRNGGQGDGYLVTATKHYVTVVFQVRLPKVLKKKQLSVGSIVEGCDFGTGIQYLPFPFEEQAWWDALQAVEDEASYIWDQTHGCPDCGMEGEWGHPAINYDCPTCHGVGVVK